MPRIDSHHHLWNYDPAQYGWISDSMSVLKRDFDVSDLDAVLTPNRIQGAVSVQARQTLEETHWLLKLANEFPQLFGVVGWVPLFEDETKLRPLLEELSQQPKLVGVRHVIHDEPDDRFILRADFGRGIRLLHGYGFTYDILIFARHLPQTLTFVDRHTDQRFILDHIAKPTIRPEQFDEAWAKSIRKLAERPHVACKVSGMVTEVRADQWSVDLLRPYWDVVLEAFGPERLMYGSDWPVCLLRSDYSRWVETVETLASELSPSEQEQFWGGTAQQWYKLSIPN